MTMIVSSYGIINPAYGTMCEMQVEIKGFKLKFYVKYQHSYQYMTAKYDKDGFLENIFYALTFGNRIEYLEWLEKWKDAFQHISELSVHYKKKLRKSYNLQDPIEKEEYSLLLEKVRKLRFLSIIMMDVRKRAKQISIENKNSKYSASLFDSDGELLGCI